jgi:CMP-N-acetylneuraminic acid synthetase
MNAAIITARAGSKSILNKNVYEVNRRPLIYYPIRAAQDARTIDRVYISTDGESIAEVGQRMGCEIIWRPEELGGDHINHGDVIRHAVEWVDERSPLANVALLLGNTVMIDGEMLDAALTLLDQRQDLDSVMTVWEAADDHPMRALDRSEDGLLTPYGDPDRRVSTERQSYKKAYYYDQGVWAFRKETVQRRDGPNPWWWMGKRSYGIVRNWVTGRDIHTHLDISIAEWWLAHYPEIKKL